jgi:hypothetical protein
VVRAAAAGLSVIAAAVTGVVMALVTAHPSQGLWVALGVAVLIGGGLQGWITYRERSGSKPVQASGAGAVAVGGSSHREIRTHVRGVQISPTEPGKDDGVAAAGSGSVGIGGDAIGRISTDVTGDEDPAI